MTLGPSNPFTTALVLASALLAPAAWAQSTDLSACMAELRPAARSGKVSDATWSRHTAGLQADFSVIEKLNFQPEFRTPIWDYMSALVDEERVADGAARLVAGNAMDAYPQLSAAPPGSVYLRALPSAAALLRLAAGRLDQVVAAAQALPLYVRDKVAQTTQERLALKAGQAAPSVP